MKSEELARTIYLGDRACKAILIDSWKKRIAIQVDVISRLKPGAKTWDFYSGGDITNGWIVFSEVRGISFDPPGPVPNDLINDFTVSPSETGNSESAYSFNLSIGSVNDAGEILEVHVRIEAARIHLEDPARPGLEIKE